MSLLIACTNIERNGDDEDKALDDVLIGNIDHHEIHAVGEGHNNKCTDNGVCHLTHAAADSRAADVGGGELPAVGVAEERRDV